MEGSEMGEPGALSASDRFDRLERQLNDGLLRIEQKLDAKADAIQVMNLSQRVDSIENGTTPLARMYLREFEDVGRRVSDLEDKGSRSAREAVDLGHALAAKVETLSRTADEQTAVVRANGERFARRYQFFGALAGLITVANAIIGAALLLH